MPDSQLKEELIHRLHEIYPENKDTLLNFLCTKNNVSLRINTLKTNVADMLSFFEAQHITYQKIPWYDDAVVVTNLTSKNITDLAPYKEGKLYIQSLSSMIPALILAPTVDDSVLDMAAAPGSKTTQMAALMNNKGAIVANDISHERLYKLKAILAQQGVSNTSVTNYAGQSIWQKYPEHFDKVLVDAPCSMEGRINCDDPASYADWSMKKIKRLSKLQKWLLRSAVSATKVGGTIVYSTCTMAPEENEEVIEWILEKEQGRIQLEPIAIENLTMADGIQSWNNKTFSTEITKTKRILPDSIMEGFYIAKIKKIASNVY